MTDARKPSLADLSMIPPTSVLNAREGWWQDRKRAWLPLGIQSGLGTAIVCAMWLTGFRRGSTLHIYKPMKALTLMQVIAWANRLFSRKDFGLIVDYTGMLASPGGAGAICAWR